MYIAETAVLTPRQTEQVQALQQAAYAPEGLENAAWLSNELNFDRAMPCFYLAWEQDAPAPQDAPVAFLTLFLPTREQAEVVAFTHPAHRRAGYFKALCARAAARCREAGIPEFLFAVEPRSVGGCAALAAMPGCVWSHSEYRMEYTGPAPASAERLALRRVNADGAAQYRAFLEQEMGETDVDNYVAAALENPERAAYLVLLDGAPAGMFHINLGELPGRAFLYGVGVAPGLRGRGLGQELMALALAEARAVRDIVVLDVDSGNASAYHIYKKLGFCVTFGVDYHRAPMMPGDNRQKEK